MRRILFLLFAVTCSGCTTLFHDNFEADTVGLQPWPSPAGRPTGDMVRIWGANPGNLVVTADGISGKSLIHSYQPSVSQADFIGIETERAVHEYWATWNGRAESFRSAAPRFFFTVGNFNTGTANLEIDNGQWFCSGERLGDVALDEDHTVIMHVDNRAGTYTVTIFQTTSTAPRAACPEGFRFEGGECRSGPNWLGHMSHCPLEGPSSCATCRAGETLDTTDGTCITRVRSNASCRDRPLSSRGLIPGDKRLSIVMSYDNTATSDPSSYIIDDVWISTKAPEMP
jgi:hypothetical protein